MSLGFGTVGVSPKAVDIMSVFENAAAKPAQKQSTLSTVLGPDHKPQSKVSGADGLKRSPDKPAGDIKVVQQTAGALKQEAKADLATMEKGWDKARDADLQAAEQIGPGIAEHGITSAAVRASHGKAEVPTLASSIGHAAVDMATSGAGTLAKIATNGASAILDAAGSRRNLSSTQKEKLYQTMAAQTKMTPSQVEVARLSGAKAQVAKAHVAPELDKLDARGHEELLNDVKRGREFEEQRATIAALEGVEANNNRTAQIVEDSGGEDGRGDSGDTDAANNQEEFAGYQYVAAAVTERENPSAKLTKFTDADFLRFSDPDKIKTIKDLAEADQNLEVAAAQQAQAFNPNAGAQV